MGSSMRVTGRQVSRWPLKFYFPQGQHEIFQPWRSANEHALPPGLTELATCVTDQWAFDILIHGSSTLQKVKAKWAWNQDMHLVTMVVGGSLWVMIWLLSDGLIASPWLSIHSVVATLCAIKGGGETRSNLPTGPCDRVNAYELLWCCGVMSDCAWAWCMVWLLLCV